MESNSSADQPSCAVRNRLLLASAVALEAGFAAIRLLGDLETHVVEFIAVYLAISPFYLVSVWLLTRKGASLRDDKRLFTWLCLAGVVFRLTLLPMEPQLSEDLVRYRWQGMLQVAGGNPYVDVPQDAQWSTLQDSTWAEVTRKELPSVYGPVYELLHSGWQRVASAVWPGDPYAQVWSYKLPFALFEIGAAAALVWVLVGYGAPMSAAVVWLWSPLVLVEFWAQGHNDTLTVMLVLLALGAAVRTRWPLAFGALTVAAMAKFWPLILFPFFLLEKTDDGWRLRWKPALVSVPIVIALALPYWGAVSNVTEILEGFVGGWRNNDSVYALVYEYAEEDFDRGTELVGRLLVAGLAGVWALQLGRVRGSLWAIVLLLFLSANCFPWYLSWFLPLLALAPNAALLLWVSVVPLAYNVLVPYGALGEWEALDGFRRLEYWPVFGLLLGGWMASGIALWRQRR